MSESATTPTGRADSQDDREACDKCGDPTPTDQLSTHILTGQSRMCPDCYSDLPDEKPIMRDREQQDRRPDDRSSLDEFVL